MGCIVSANRQRPKPKNLIWHRSEWNISPWSSEYFGWTCIYLMMFDINLIRLVLTVFHSFLPNWSQILSTEIVCFQSQFSNSNGAVYTYLIMKIERKRSLSKPKNNAKEFFDPNSPGCSAYGHEKVVLCKFYCIFSVVEWDEGKTIVT